MITASLAVWATVVLYADLTQGRIVVIFLLCRQESSAAYGPYLTVAMVPSLVFILAD